MAETSIIHNSRPFLPSILFLAFLILSLAKSDAQVGVNYGTTGDNLPPAEQTVAVLKQYNIRRLRLYGPNQAALQALIGTNIEVFLGVRNDEIAHIAASQENADWWFQTNVRAFYPGVRFRYITVGNEISPTNTASSGVAPYVLPAMRNIYNAAGSLGIKVTTAFDFGVLGTSYPPSSGSFKEELKSYVIPIIEFLVRTNGPACFNIHPYFAYAGDANNIRLDYALGTAAAVVVQDGFYGYTRLFDAMVDAAHSALEKVGGGALAVVVTETGWPTAGGVSTSSDTAMLYNSNLIQHVTEGSPKRPGQPIEAYLFALFDENQKSPEVEKHWGLFTPDKFPKYHLSFN